MTTDTTTDTLHVRRLGWAGVEIPGIEATPQDLGQPRRIGPLTVTRVRRPARDG